MKYLSLALLFAFVAAGLAACGQRVTPTPPEGKLYPSSEY